ncbi:MAG: chloride channel protein [Candidatus Competibacteraceae bacterium]
MNPISWIKSFALRYLDDTRLRLAARRAPWQLALLGAWSGLVAGVVMVAFRLVTEIPQVTFLGDANHENYEALSAALRLLLPTLGGLGVGLLFHWLSPTERAVGVVHVMERLAYGEGHLPIKNAGVQFFSAALCIVTGQSVGREGPAVHIGSTCGSWLGQQLRLPDNSIRVLVGCGTAGAIAAAFNTPLAGVIFAMEVILVEYTLASFTPIILAAASATTVSY